MPELRLLLVGVDLDVLLDGGGRFWVVLGLRATGFDVWSSVSVRSMVTGLVLIWRTLLVTPADCRFSRRLLVVLAIDLVAWLCGTSRGEVEDFGAFLTLAREALVVACD